MLLGPVIRVPDEPDVYFLPDEESGHLPESCEARARLDEEFEAGTMHRITPPLAWQAGHVLLQVELDKPPELLPAEKREKRLAEIGHEALVRAATHRERRRHLDAAAWAWRALRALPKEPFPLLAVIALERDSLSARGLAELTANLQHFDADAVTDSMERFRHYDQLTTLIALVSNDPVYIDLVAPVTSCSSPQRRPSYLQKYREAPGFIHKSRRVWRQPVAQAA